ncbi:DKNYY domain-containing protein [Agrobacterium vaccinii]|uniref:DKNYY domain-containing protein n=1 Tax=Agrobacterium vaccinii TaxID=2735528 RepID=UPI001E4854E5|nr:DKNYY domain-containing protein [Agrobacterium vaccinii]UHS56081.1 DKNYY domain-containing protein [Agrobacterium vaccinii]
MSDAFTVRDKKVFLIDGSDEPVEVKGGISPQDFAVVSQSPDRYLWSGYLRDKKGIWWYHQRNKKAKFVTSDADGFRVVNDDYGLDGAHVYLEDRVIPGADPRSFSLMENTNYFAKDKHRLYVKTGSRFFHVDKLDPATLVANGPYVGDKHDLYYLFDSLTLSNSSKLNETVRYSLCKEHHMLLTDWLAKHYPDTVGWWHPAYPFNADGAEQIADDWYRTSNAVFFKETLTTMRTSQEVFNLVRGADPASFEPLDAFHARDAKNVFCRSRRIDGVDRETFLPIEGLFGKDKAGVYFNGYLVEHADPAKFQVLRSVVPLAKDNKRVYVAAHARTTWPFGYPDDILVTLDEADADSFRTFGERGVWAADAARVYLRGEHQKKLDDGSFRFLCETKTNCWAADDKGLYRSNGTLIVAGIDGRHFVKLNDFWGSDGKAVFSFVTGAIQKAMDAESFVVTDESGGGRDAAFSYRVDNGSIRKTKR